VYDQNRFAASRFGPRATLIHPDRDEPASVPELYGELAGRIGVQSLDPTTCEADLQEASDEPRTVAADVVARTLR
jgi:hypothetical protein